MRLFPRRDRARTAGASDSAGLGRGLAGAAGGVLGGLRKRAYLIVPLAVLVAGVLLRIADPQPLVELRYRAFDLYQKIEPRQDPNLPVTIVAIDEASVRRIGQWPWPRHVLARLVDRLRTEGAQVIAFDVLFPEKDRMTPTAVLDLMTPQARSELARAIARGETTDPDTRFAEAIAEAPVVLSFSGTADPFVEDIPFNRPGFAVIGESPLPYVQRFPAAVVSHRQLQEAATGNGATGLIKDVDGVVRRMPLVLAIGDELVTSFPVEILRVAQKARGIQVKVSGQAQKAGSGALTGVQAIRVGRITIPSTPQGEIWLYNSPPRLDEFLPAWKLLTSGEPLPDLNGHMVLIGATAVGLFDFHATPLAASLPGILQHAQVLEQIMTGAFLNRPAWSDGAEILAVALLGLLVLLAFALPRVGPALSALLGGVLVAAAVAGTWWAFTVKHLLFDPITPALVGLAVYASAGIVSFMVSERQRHRIRRAFGQYVSSEVANRIADNPHQVTLGGENRELTILFCDIRGFTSISEHMAPEVLARLINRFLTTMSEAVLDSHGTIDKYIGDCLMAFWNAPLPVPNHATRACETVLEMRHRLEILNAELASQEEGGKPIRLRMGIGLNTGPCSVGNMGSSFRLAYTALGDAVNLASRLEGTTKNYGTDIVVSHGCRRAADELAFLEIDRITVRGRTLPETVYALLGGRDLAQTPDYRDLVEAQGRFLESFRKGEREVALARLDAVARHAERFRLEGLCEHYRREIDRAARRAAKERPASPAAEVPAG